MSIQKPEWFKVDAAKFLSDARVDAMSTLELGACFRLLCRQWLDGSIPDDARLLARLCRLDEPSMREAWLTLCDFFPVVEPGKRANRFMWIEREKVIADLERRSDEGTRAANKRWNEARKNPGDATPIATPNGSPIPLPMQDQTRPDQTRADTEQSRKTSAQTVFAREPELSNGYRSSNRRPTESDIQKIYRLYPRKRAPIAAKKAIRKAVSVVMNGDADHPAIPAEESLDYLAGRVSLYAACVQGCARNYVPYPASWFNSGAFWDDEDDWKEQIKKSDNSNHSNGQDVIADVVARLAQELA